MKWLSRIFTGTLLAILVFFAVSFLTVLLQLNTPFHRTEWDRLEIGFPFVYYIQFTSDDFLHAGWIGANLLWDIGITWLVIVGACILFYRYKDKKRE